MLSEFYVYCVAIDIDFHDRACVRASSETLATSSTLTYANSNYMSLQQTVDKDRIELSLEIKSQLEFRSDINLLG